MVFAKILNLEHRKYIMYSHQNKASVAGKLKERRNGHNNYLPHILL
jgi:hypothetical protein